MKKIAWLLSCTALAGCFTLKQTEMPAVQVSRAPEGRDVKVAVAGYAATVTDYVSVYGSQTMYVDHGAYMTPHGHVYGAGGHYETVTSETRIPQVHQTDTFIRRAQNMLEDAGFLVRAPAPDYTVEVVFGGPFVKDDERALEFVWMLCSVLSCEYATQTWTAKLRIYDTKTGRVAFSRDYSQKYEDCAWSPIFFVGLAGRTENSFNFMQSWCLTALTDRTVSEASAFLARNVK